MPGDMDLSDAEESEYAMPNVPRNTPASNQRSGGADGNAQAHVVDQDQQRAAAVEGINSEAAKFLDKSTRNYMRWVDEIDRFREIGVDDEWRAWGRTPGNPDGHLLLREKWFTWMACTSKLLQTVDNKHLNRHLDYQYAGPTVNFVDLQTTPQIGRRLQMISHFVECINNFGEFPIDCVVPTPETELLFGQGRSCKLVRGMRMKTLTERATREIELNSSLRSAEKWLKNFDRGAVSGGDEEDEFMEENVGDETTSGKGGMVETQMVRLVVRLFPVVHKNFKGLGRVISLVGLPGVNVAKCLQRVCDPRFYDSKHADIGRSREALWRELMHSEFGVMEGQLRHDDMEGRLCDFDNFQDRRLHIYHLCSEVLPRTSYSPCSRLCLVFLIESIQCKATVS
jgi:hypothetical protein